MSDALSGSLAQRVRRVNDRPVNREGEFVLYWMVAARRCRYNAALDHAVDTANEHGVGLVVLEALRVGYPWASDRFHAFVIDGMADNAAAVAASAATYMPYIEPGEGAGKGLLAALAARAVTVITDDFPCFFIPRMIEAAGATLETRLEAVDGNGIYPLAATDRVFTTAASFRRHLQKEIAPYLLESPSEAPLARLKKATPTIPAAVLERWPPATLEAWVGDRSTLAALPIDHVVAPTAMRGGSSAAAARLDAFVAERIERYGQRNQPDADAASGLSPYLHFGFVSSHEIFARVMRADGWDPGRLADKATGSREGWWGASAHVEGFLDELITWREIGFNMCHKRPDYDQFESLPEWAQTTLAEHADDPRPRLYSLERLAAAGTDDPIWNAAQRQLADDGIIHNYLRMLWGKRVLEWTRTPREALAVLIELNNRYALDGRDPNSYSGIFWVLGRYDRAWGPQRKIFGKVRYMSSASTKRKLRLGSYLEAHGANPSLRFE